MRTTGVPQRSQRPSVFVPEFCHPSGARCLPEQLAMVDGPRTPAVVSPRLHAAGCGGVTVQGSVSVSDASRESVFHALRSRVTAWHRENYVLGLDPSRYICRRSADEHAALEWPERSSHMLFLLRTSEGVVPASWQVNRPRRRDECWATPPRLVLLMHGSSSWAAHRIALSNLQPRGTNVASLYAAVVPCSCNQCRQTCAVTCAGSHQGSKAMPYPWTSSRKVLLYYAAWVAQCSSAAIPMTYQVKSPSSSS